jgi:GTP cyclohydrolase I
MNPTLVAPDLRTMSLRGVQTQRATTVTSAMHGLVRGDPRTRDEFLTLALGRA